MRRLLMTPVQIVLSFSLRGTENSKTQESSAGGASLFLPRLTTWPGHVVSAKSRLV